MTGAACIAEKSYPSGSPDFTSGFHRGSWCPDITLVRERTDITLISAVIQFLQFTSINNCFFKEVVNSQTFHFFFFKMKQEHKLIMR